MSITRQDVEHVAYLARLGLDDNEIDRLAAELSKILDAMQVIDRLDTSTISPTAQVIPLRNVLRADEPRPSMPLEEVMHNAPRREGDHFLVPPVLE